MTTPIATKEIQKVAEVMQSFKDNQTLLVSFLPALKALLNILDTTDTKMPIDFVKFA
jgi:hypothetical protein